MGTSDWKAMFKQLDSKPAIKEKYIKNNKPKDRKTGITAKKCERCGRYGARVGAHGLNLCRHCFREIATDIGFNKYS